MNQSRGHGTGAQRFERQYSAAVDCLRQGQLAQAHSKYSALLSEYPGNAELHNDFGHLLRLMGEPEQAIAQFEEALRLDPRHAAAAYNTAVAQAQLGRVGEAIDNYRRALSLRPDLAEAHNNLGNLLRSQGDVTQAIGHYREALKLRPQFTDAAVNLAVALENLHRLDEARDIAGKVLTAQPGDPIARLVLARIELREGKLEAARDRLQELLDAGIPPVHEVAAAAELVQACDRLGRFPEAVEAAQRGKRVARQVLGPERCNDDSFVRRVRRNREWFAPERVSEWPDSVVDGGPTPAFLVGFPRSGTTLMEQVLAAHPAISTSHEAPLLDALLGRLERILGRKVGDPDGFDSFSETDIRRLRAAYWSEATTRLGELESGSLLVDKLPLNLVHLGFVRRIFPESPVIVMLRDPRDACLSGFLQAFRMNPAMVPFLDIDRAANFYVEVMGLWLHYRETLGLNWIEVRYEDLIRDLEGRAGKALAHLGLDWDDRVLRYHESAADRYANTPSYRDVTQPVFTRSIGRWRNYESLMAPVADRLGGLVAEFGYSGTPL